MWGTTGFGYNRAIGEEGARGRRADSTAIGADLRSGQCQEARVLRHRAARQRAGVVSGGARLSPRRSAEPQPADLDRAAGVLQAIRPSIRKFHSSEYINDLANGDICVAWGYSGDIVQARNRAQDAQERRRHRLHHPEGRRDDLDRHDGDPGRRAASRRTRSNSSITSCVPRVAAKISNTVAYANPNQARDQAGRPEDPRAIRTIYPPQAVRARLFFDKPVTPQYERLRTRAWTRIKTGQ